MIRARHWQKATDPVRTMWRGSRRAVAHDFQWAFKNLKGVVDKEKALATGSFEAAVDWAHFRAVFRRPFDTLIRVHDDAAAYAVKRIGRNFAERGAVIRYKKMAGVETGQDGHALLYEPLVKDVTDVFNFDRLNPATLARLRAYQDALIQQLEDDARLTIQNAVERALEGGLAADEIVDAVLEVITLTDVQAQYVANYRAQLEAMDPAALNRRLMSQAAMDAFDEAYSAGESLPAAVIDGLVTDYADKFEAYRAQTIADTETVRAANLGLHDVYLQAVDTGVIPQEAIVRSWQVSLDEKTCPICLSIPDNNPNGVGVDELFDSDDGPVDDPPVHPNCRCSVEYVTNLDMLS